MSADSLPQGSITVAQSGRGARSGTKGLRVACVVLLILTVGAVRTAQQRLESVFSDLDSASLGQARSTLSALLDQQRARLIASVQILSEDTRIRSTAMTTGFDEGTIRDILEDLKKGTHANVLAVLDERGKVRAVTGADGLREMDLGSSAVIKAALEGPASNFWALPDQVLIIGVAPIRAGRRVPALLLMGLSLGKQQLSAVQEASGVVGSILVGDRIIASSSEDPRMVDIVRTANAIGGIDNQVLPGHPDFLVRMARINDSTTAAKVFWATPRHRQTQQARVLRFTIWAPAIFAAMTLGLVLLLTRKRNGGLS
jgi:hypothetical protein